jgi:hypothetical protein
MDQNRLFVTQVRKIDFIHMLSIYVGYSVEQNELYLVCSNISLFGDKTKKSSLAEKLALNVMKFSYEKQGLLYFLLLFLHSCSEVVYYISPLSTRFNGQIPDISSARNLYGATVNNIPPSPQHKKTRLRCV